jgi:hypothetical protein
MAMTRSAPFNFLPDLQRPLRDALRGVATLADAAEDALEPASALLPERLRSRFHSALKSIERAGKRLISAPIDAGLMTASAGFMAGADRERGARQACATVFVFAWEHLAEASVKHHYMISETIVADRFFRVANNSGARGADFAAALMTEIRGSSAIGRIPGLARGIHPDEAGEIDLALLSIATWMLSSRPETLGEEEKLLDLSLALVRALHIEAPDIFDDQARLSGFLAETSAHL